jgi:hypothetical protein
VDWPAADLDHPSANVKRSHIAQDDRFEAERRREGQAK